jgi:hypothetical protein
MVFHSVVDAVQYILIYVAVIPPAWEARDVGLLHRFYFYYFV